ncbi:DUF4352 domain-containing protein [Carnobacterium maltaromaticum]|uniref:DUF4352 domain-containing protein n=1 Tax=Carnobacterium maltaromaticum TaxID=2751 RepID=UPI00165B72FE|nr:DUF4352 domain-containing protein [Carnobacterium maltaromaticum]MBC9787222.1 DUF4352 domain-containing protein [Carnobacterium maltaromaticum]
MKKLISLSLIGMLAVTLVACGGGADSESENSISSKNSSETQEEDYSDYSDEEDVSDSEFSVGESVEFESGLIVTLDSVEDSSEEPNGDISGHLVKVVMTFDNQTSNSLDINGHNLSLYDGGRNKAELNAKDYYSETIAAGMKGTGTFYFDSMENAPYSVIFGDATWISN